MADDLLDLFHRSAEVADRTVSQVRPDQFDEPTPCAAWTVRDLLNHVVTGNLMFVAMATGTPGPDRGVEHLGQDHVAAFRGSVARLSATFGEPDFLRRPVATPFGEGTGATLVDMRFNEFLVHSWDLARATGQSTDLDHDLVGRSLAAMRASPVLRHARGEGGPFGPERPAPAGATPADQLAAFMGRVV